jgi:hypothetical protein
MPAPHVSAVDAVRGPVRGGTVDPYRAALETSNQFAKVLTRVGDGGATNSPGLGVPSQKPLQVPKDPDPSAGAMETAFPDRREWTLSLNRP